MASAPATSLFQTAWGDTTRAIRTSWPTLFVGVVVATGAQLVAQVPVQMALASWMRVQSGGSSDAEAVQSWFAVAVAVVVAVGLSLALSIPAVIGSMALAVDAVRGKAGNFKALWLPFSSVSRYAQTIGIIAVAWLLQLLVAAAIAMPFIGGVLSLATSGVWDGDLLDALGTSGIESAGPPDRALLTAAGACFIVGVLVLVLTAPLQSRLALLIVRAADPDRPLIGVMAAVREFLQGSRGKGWGLAGFLCASGLMSLLTVLLCGVGIFLLGYPLMLAALAAAYDCCLPGPRVRQADPLVIGARPPMDSEPL